METAIYELGGLRIVSDFPLFGLQACQNEVEVDFDVAFRCTHIPEQIASAVAKSGTYNGREVLLDIPAVARFLLRAGKEILIDLAPSADDDEVRDRKSTRLNSSHLGIS